MLNPNWEKLGITPLDYTLREAIGRSVDKDKPEDMAAAAEDLLGNPDKWRDRIREARERNIFHPGESGRVAAEYIIGQLTKPKE